MQGLVFESAQLLTQTEFVAFVEECERVGDRAHYELLNGRVVMNPPAGYPHGEIESNVQWVVGKIVREHGLGKVFGSSQGFELSSGDTVEPDHSFVSAARWSAAPPPESGKFLRVVPDLVVEILSTRTASQDRGEKKAIYERNAVLEYWLVDPRSRQVTAFSYQDGHFDGGAVHAESEGFASRILNGAEVRVDELLNT